MLAPTSKVYFHILIICRARQFTFPHREGGNRRLTEGFPILPITYYLRIKTPQSLRDSSPKSGAKWLTIVSCSFLYHTDDHQHFCYAKTNLTDLPINLSVQYVRPYKQRVTTTYINAMNNYPILNTTKKTSQT